jgi:hypothetical protein
LLFRRARGFADCGAQFRDLARDGFGLAGEEGFDFVGEFILEFQ